MAHRGVGNKESGYGMERRSNSPGTELHVTAGGVLTPVKGFKGPGVTGKPPPPEHRGFPKEPGEGNLPGGAKRKAGGNNALKAFGLAGSGQNEK